jgi:hypothetical protein
LNAPFANANYYLFTFTIEVQGFKADPYRSQKRVGKNGVFDFFDPSNPYSGWKRVLREMVDDCI